MNLTQMQNQNETKTSSEKPSPLASSPRAMEILKKMDEAKAASPRKTLPPSLYESALRGDHVPDGGRLLLRAVTLAEQIETGLIIPEGKDLRAEAYHEVISVDPSLDESILRKYPVGSFVLHASCAFDVVDPTKGHSCDLVLVHHEDIILRAK